MQEIPEGFFNLGNALAKAGRHADAFTAFHRATVLKPALTEAARQAQTLAEKMASERLAAHDPQGAGYAVPPGVAAALNVTARLLVEPDHPRESFRPFTPWQPD